MKNIGVTDDMKLVDRSNTKGEIKEMSYQVEEDYLRASNPNTSGRILNDLAKSEDPNIRKQVAENPNSCLATLYRLLFDSDPDVRINLSYNRFVPEFFLEYLVTDLDDDVRYALCENPRLSVELLAKLALDENPYISSRAKLSIERTHCLVNGCAA